MDSVAAAIFLKAMGSILCRKYHRTLHGSSTHSILLPPFPTATAGPPAPSSAAPQAAPALAATSAATPLFRLTELCVCVFASAVRSRVHRLAPPIKGPLPALHLPFPLGGRCTGRRGEGPCLPRTAVPVRWAVRGEARPPDRAGSLPRTAVPVRWAAGGSCCCLLCVCLVLCLLCVVV